MADLLPLADLLTANDPRWPSHHQRALDEASADLWLDESWALFSIWRSDLPVAASWAQYRTPVANLYMCGSATHPGGGIMGAPGRNAAMQILADGR